MQDADLVFVLETFISRARGEQATQNEHRGLGEEGTKQRRRRKRSFAEQVKGESTGNRKVILSFGS